MLVKKLNGPLDEAQMWWASTRGSVTICPTAWNWPLLESWHDIAGEESYVGVLKQGYPQLLSIYTPIFHY